MFKRKLACSFCGRSEADVEKLVAGPRVYICERCTAEVVRIMNDADQSPPARSRPSAPSAFRWIRDLWRGRSSDSTDLESVMEIV